MASGDCLYVGRFRLFHKGYLEVVKYILEESGSGLIIAVGAAEVSHREDNPFTGEERVSIIESALMQQGLRSKVQVIPIGETNARYEDFEVAARILKGKKVHRNVMMKIVPSTQEVYGDLLKNGLIKIFYEAGAIITNPGCGGCASGQIGMTGKGEVQVSTGNRNFAGKQGAGDTYLASPATAAATALIGEISVPDRNIL